MIIAKTKQELRDAIGNLRKSQHKIALVPTMGALHDGHISLVETALKHADSVVVSIFVNPTQFSANEDFSKYPRTEKQDIERLESAKVAIAYIPTIEEIYSKDSVTSVHVAGISEELCGATRFGHFDGVATIVTKLFMQTQPDFAVFGEKDYQQLHIIKQFSRDLDIPVKIIPSPIMRESDGLAMSSRNRYLSDSERKIAANLYKTLQNIAKGKDIEAAKTELLAAGFTKIDYIELRDADTLKPTNKKHNARLRAALFLGKTRLIDNIAIDYSISNFS